MRDRARWVCTVVAAALLAAGPWVPRSAADDPETRTLMQKILDDPPNKRHHEEIKMAKAFLGK